MSAAAQPAAFDFWAEAAQGFMASSRAPRAEDLDATAWDFADVAAMHSLGNLARVLAAMGLVRRVMIFPRRDTALWYENRQRCAAVRDQVAAFPVFLMCSDDRSAWVWVCSVTGDWATQSGAARGEGVTGLGAYMWQQSRGQAARQIARVLGYRGLPRVRDLR